LPRSEESRYNLGYNEARWEKSMATLKITQIGNSLGLILPREIVERLRLAKGETVSVVETPQGIEITPFDPDFDQKLEAARKVAKRYRNALRELAK
jgi:putative addiction module antidote